MPRRPPPPPRFPELLGWSLFGLAIGSAGGMLLAELLGTRPRRRREGDSARDTGGTLTSGQTAERVRRAISEDAALADVDVRVLGIAPGVVEVGGWVADRATRARLARLVRSVRGVDTMVNSILVRGEDDPPPPPTLHISDRTA